MKITIVTGDIITLKTDAIIVYTFQGAKSPSGDTVSVDKALEGAIGRLMKQGAIKGTLSEITLLHTLGKLPAERVAVVGLGVKKEMNLNKIRSAIAETCRCLRKAGAINIASIVPGADVNGINREGAAQALAEGATLGLYTFRRYITKKEDAPGEIKTLSIASAATEKTQLEEAVSKGQTIAETANWARDIVNEPANNMTPDNMAEAAQQLAATYGLSVEVLDRQRMAKLGMGGLLGVSQGSQQPPRFIILGYKGKTTTDIDLALVGKGITFDAGGISIKPSEGMADMKGDMAGGASVMATLIATARLKPKINITALVPATENLPSGTALKPGDIIKIMNGETVEVLNTDAEGRLILADALCYAEKLKAKAIVDVATLTGACMVALGKICTGVFGNNQALADKVIAAGKEAGELSWQLPMFEEYREQLKSNIADIKNIGNRYGGAITAAKFLADFIKDTPWVHLDIAGTADSEKESGYLVKGATGVPVRTLVNLAIALVK